MRNSNCEKPRERSKLRLWAGKCFYSTLKQISRIKHRPYALKRTDTPLGETVFRHETILLRRLKDIDMRFQYNKITNLRIASSRVDGLLLYPGETFSYWKLIGRPTYRKGYLDGLVLGSGKLVAGVGGGLCQLSNLIYWMTLHTPLTVVERHRHGYDLFPDSNRTQPFGSGATCYYPYGDLMIRNDTDMVFQLRVRVGEENLEGEWRSDTPLGIRYEIIERNHMMKSEFWGGFSRHNEIWRRIYNDEGELISEELITENHALMTYSPFIESAFGASHDA
ncbi:MAG: VanW family protein [Oscillospiraceae bacterium]